MIAEARNEGILVGEKRGKKFGINEVMKKRNTQIAKSMIQKKFNLNSISEITGLSIK